MAPKGGPGKDDGEEELYIHQINRSPEYEDFIAKLTAFHEARGTAFEAEPRLPTMHGHVHVDLLQLYRAVISKGGYDEIGKVQKAWGNLANELGMYFDDNKGMGQLSFQLKQDFYRYLAAYWVKDQYNKDPPPKEILEQQSCASKHGPVLTRTLESFKLAGKRNEEGTPSKPDRDSRANTPSQSGGTPGPPNNTTPVSGTRASGRLREAPPQRVPFQPETGPSRQPNRQSAPTATAPSHQGTPTANPPMSQTPTPAPVHHHHNNNNSQNLPPHHNPNNPLHLIQAQQAALRGASTSFIPTPSDSSSRLSDPFEPRPQITVPLRPVQTPGNNPVEFAKRQRQLRAQQTQGAAPQQPSFATIPGISFEGPNIYTRCLQALRSGVPEEQGFALSHLVKISFERGDKYKFDSFPGLAEGLVDKALEIGSLFSHVNWEVGFSNDQDRKLDLLDGINGTDDILDRISKLTPRPVLDYMQPAGFSDRFLRITESVLTLRNMVMLQDNAIYMADVVSLRDLLCIILNLPNMEMLVEVKHFALDVAEQVTPYMDLDSDDPLYQSLLAQLNSTDRGTILTALRAISRISMNLEATNKLQDVPAVILQNIMNWLLLNDEELMDACLDFLYQYTAVVANVESILKAVDMEHMIPHLVRLLSHGAKRFQEDRILEPERQNGSPEEICAPPAALQERLSKTEEPQRCFHWLQSLFEEDPQSHITQIAIWQAYQSSFGGQQQRNMLSAADFIRNVSSVFSGARAQIIRGPGEMQRFIIEGIRPRPAPMDYETKEDYTRCQWVTGAGPTAKNCGTFAIGGEKMWYHVLTTHLGVKLGEDGKIEDRQVESSCEWAGCQKYPGPPTTKKLSELTSHIKTHVASPRKRSGGDKSESATKRPRRSFVVPAKTMSLSWEQTLVTRDEKNPKLEQAAGIPLSAVLVLRNIARNVVKTEAEDELLKKRERQPEGHGESGGWNEKLFRPVMSRLFGVMTENKAMADYITSLLQLVQAE